MKENLIKDLISKHAWLIEMAAKYINQRKTLERSIDHIQITQIKYVNCSDREEIFEFNSHHVINPKPFIEAIDEGIEDLKKQIREIEETLPMVEFEERLVE